jgi:hypothetical protein
VPTSRIARDFSSRSHADQKWLLENTWCRACDAADLGMRDPYEYAEDGAIYVEGSCLRCGSSVRSAVEVVEATSQGLPPNTSLERTRER